MFSVNIFNAGSEGLSHFIARIPLLNGIFPFYHIAGGGFKLLGAHIGIDTVHAVEPAAAAAAVLFPEAAYAFYIIECLRLFQSTRFRFLKSLWDVFENYWCQQLYQQSDLKAAHITV